MDNRDPRYVPWDQLSTTCEDCLSTNTLDKWDKQLVKNEIFISCPICTRKISFGTISQGER